MKKIKKLVALALALLFLCACGPKEAAVTPTPSPTPLPSPTLETTTPLPSPAPTPELIPEPVCILAGDDIVSLCDTSCFQNAMITADGYLLAWGEISFDLEKCLLLQDNGGGLSVYRLPLRNITGAWLGRSSILALEGDGTLWGMGSNVHGQLWNAETHEGFDTPVKLTDHVVSASISQWDYSAALKDDGGVWLMGSGTDMTGDSYLPPTQITKIKGATELYVGRYLYVRDKEGVSWRIGDIGELLDDPTAVTLSQHSGTRQLSEDLWLTDKRELIRTLDGGKETVLTDVADVDLSYGIYATAVTRDGDLYVWNEESMDEYGCLTVDAPTKVMEGVKLAGAWEHGVVVVTKADGAVWAIYADALNAALADGTLITLPERAGDPLNQAYKEERQRGLMEELYHRPFEELPQELRDSLKWDGKIETIEGYSFRLRTYTAPGITIVTTEATEEALESFLEFQLSQLQNEREVRGDNDAVRAEIEGEKGREWLYSFTLEDDRYATELGLKVGSTVAEAEALGYTFPEEQLAAGRIFCGVPMETHLEVTVEDGVVIRLEGSFGLGRYVGRYWDI